MAQHEADMQANDEVIRNGMRADVAIMLDGLARAQHQAMERERMQQEVMQRHLDLAAAHRDRMISALDRLGAVTPGVGQQITHGPGVTNQVVNMQDNEMNFALLQQIHQQTLHMGRHIRTCWPSS